MSENMETKIVRFPVTAGDLRRAGHVAREQAKRRKRFVRRMITAFALILLTVMIFVLISAKFGRAEGSSQRTKKLTSVYVESGDSLWSIAKKYYSPECGDLNDYIREIKRTNSLNSNTILYGYTLLVPYYE